jgi:hypothetical protein
MSHYFFESMPMAGVYVSVVLLILVACETGILIGRLHQRMRKDEGAQASVGPMVGGLLGMLAFLLAFTFSTASGHHGARKQDVLSEALHIGTAALRADLIDDTRGAQVKRLLREYVDVRLVVVRPGGNLDEALERSQQIHDEIWALAVAAAREVPGHNSALLIESVNDVIDLHERRLTDDHLRIPARIWVGLILITLLTMGTLGLQIGLSGKRRLVGVIPIALTFAVLVTLIVDLNRPQGGYITVSQQPLVDTLERLR